MESPKYNYDEYKETKESLLQAKQEIGDIKKEELIGPLENSFRSIGEKNAERIRLALEFKLKSDEGGNMREFTDKGLEITKQKIEELRGKNPEVVKALERYFDCLNSWAEGAGITEREAWFLQNENVGCQTVMVRGQDGEVFIAHTEEWGLDENEKEFISIIPEWTIFKESENDNEKKSLQAFTGYPFSLPGSAFGISRGVFTAVDLLYLNEPEEPGIPANVAAWLCWNLGGQVDAETILKTVGPYYDGYAYNEVKVDGSRVAGRRLEFAKDMLVKTDLGQGSLDYLVQTNVIESSDIQNLHGWKFEEGDEDDLYYKKLKASHETIRKVWRDRALELGKKSPKLTLDSLAREMGMIPTNRKFETIPDVATYATMVAVVRPDGYEARIAGGPKVWDKENKEKFLKITHKQLRL